VRKKKIVRMVLARKKKAVRKKRKNLPALMITAKRNLNLKIRPSDLVPFQKARNFNK
jgi:hypothetical protein